MQNMINKKRLEKQKWLILGCFGLIYIFLSSVPTYSLAEGKVIPEWIMPKHYPSDGFDWMGTIDIIDISQGKAVIGDIGYQIASYAEYHTPTKKDVPGSLFKPGDFVGFIMDPRTKQIVSFYLIDMKK
ncbi:MAG: hypothetical protein JW932_10700 [Deltaproteobacteria bacterium]|nr:hypothetical protein [Deltaproteobacteria bacterium]